MKCSEAREQRSEGWGRCSEMRVQYSGVDWHEIREAMGTDSSDGVVKGSGMLGV